MKMKYDAETLASLRAGGLFPCIDRASGHVYLGRDFSNAVFYDFGKGEYYQQDISLPETQQLGKLEESQ